MHSLRRTCLLAASASLATLLAGCSLSPTGEAAVSPGVVLAGAVQGGQQPIVGAKLYLLAAGTGGYGTASTSLLTSGLSGSDNIGGYVLTTAGGSFSITGDYACTPGTQVYLYALGGNTGAGVNANAGLLAALGNCPASGSLATQTPFILINEVTTVAAAYSLAGFATDATHISSSGTALAQTGVKNAFLTAANLAVVSSGSARTATVTGTGVIPQSEIDTLANILASCVNSAAPTFSTCSTLFANTKSAGATGTTPTDTATAAINLAHNPGVNTAALFALAGGSGAPFQPTLTTAPNDFSVAIQYKSDSSLLAFDSAGNLWENGGGLFAHSNNGTLLSPTAGYTGPYTTGSSYSDAIAIDPSDNVWIASSAACGGPYSISKFNNAGVALAGLTGAGGLILPNQMAIDGTGSVWVSNTNISGTGYCTQGSYGYLPATISRFTTSQTTNAIVTVAGSPYSGNLGNQVGGLAFDSTGSLWVSSGIFGTTTSPGSSQLNKFTSAGVPVTIAATTAGGGSLAIDSANNVFGEDYGPMYKIQSTGVNAAGSPYTLNTALNRCLALAVDGVGNVWCASDDDSIGEMTNTGTAISPDAGYISPNASGPQSIAIDSSGNVWVGDGYTSGYDSNNHYYFYSLTWEMVGGAAPVVTPLSLAVKNGTIGQRP